MTCFEVLVNGTKLCIAGIENEFGSIGTILNWIKRDLNHFPEERRHLIPEEELRFNVSGSISHSKDQHESVYWVEQNLEVGDVVTIRIIESKEIDPPKKQDRKSR